MSDQKAHTPGKFGEPWEVDEETRSQVRVTEASGATVCGKIKHKEDAASTERARIQLARASECVNALSGLNPAGVKGAVEAAEKLLKHVEDYIEDLRHISTVSDDYDESYRVEKNLNNFRTALAKLREDS